MEDTKSWKVIEKYILKFKKNLFLNMGKRIRSEFFVFIIVSIKKG